MSRGPITFELLSCQYNVVVLQYVILIIKIIRSDKRIILWESLNL